MKSAKRVKNHVLNEILEEIQLFPQSALFPVTGKKAFLRNNPANNILLMKYLTGLIPFGYENGLS